MPQDERNPSALGEGKGPATNDIHEFLNAYEAYRATKTTSMAPPTSAEPVSTAPTREDAVTAALGWLTDEIAEKVAAKMGAGVPAVQPSGVSSPRRRGRPRKLSDEALREIWAEPSPEEGGRTNSKLALKFKVHPETIRQTRAGLINRRVGGEPQGY